MHAARGARRVLEWETLTDAAAPDQVDDREQDDSAEERDQQSAQAEIPLIDRPGPEQRGEQPAAQQGADDADHDVENYTLLGIGLHHHAGKPADQTSDDQPNDEIHGTPPMVDL